MKKKDRREFEQVLRSIRGAEEDVDKVLKAARLQRRERSSFWEGTEFIDIVFGALVLISVLGMFTFIILVVLAS